MTSPLHLDLNRPVKLKPPLLKALAVVLRRVGAYLFLIAVVGGALDQWISQAMQAQLMSTEGAGSMIWVYGLFSILVSMVFPLLSLVLVVLALQEPLIFTPTELFSRALGELNQVLIETLRSWGRAMAWSFLFILPGLIKWLRYSFVPLIALCLPSYRQGERDALKTSEQVSRGQLGKLIGLFAVFSVILPLVMTSFDEYKLIWKTPVASLLLTAAECSLTVIFMLLLIRIFANAAEKNLRESL